MRRWFGAVLLLLLTGAAWAQAPLFTRPGSISLLDITGEVRAVVDGREQVPTLEERLKAAVTFTTGRLSTTEVELSNGTRLQIGSESELSVEEFWQQPHLGTGKLAEMPREPSPSRTLVRLENGDVTVHVKPLLVDRGSTFHFETVAGVLRVTEGTFRAFVRMTELGLGVCTIDLRSGSAEFEPVGKSYAPVAVGRPLSFAVELDRAGRVKLSELPPPKQ